MSLLRPEGISFQLPEESGTYQELHKCLLQVCMALWLVDMGLQGGNSWEGPERVEAGWGGSFSCSPCLSVSWRREPCNRSSHHVLRREDRIPKVTSLSAACSENVNTSVGMKQNPTTLWFPGPRTQTLPGPRTQGKAITPEVMGDKGFPGSSVVKHLPAMQEMQETQVWSLEWEDTLEEEMATHSSILAGKILGVR